MSIEVRVPALPESVADATVLTWHKQPGEAVSKDENLVDLETDKVVLEVPAPANGVLSEIKSAEGDTVQADTLLGGEVSKSMKRSLAMEQLCKKPAFSPLLQKVSWSQLRLH